MAGGGPSVFGRGQAMKLRRRAGLIFLMVTLGVLPAWANNPPQPDGLFSLILIFPVVIIGFRLAGASYTQGERKWRILRGLLLGLSVIFAMAGSETAGLPMVFLLIFGCMRGVQIIMRGHGAKRIAIGLVVCLWTLFAVTDYGVSLTVWSPVRVHQEMAVMKLRALAKAEETYSRNSVSRRYGTIEQLRDTGTPLDFPWGGGSDKGRAYDVFLNDKGWSGYRYGVSVDSLGEKFFISAVPVAYEKDVRPLVIPGTSWLYALRSRSAQNNSWKQDSEVGQRCFAIDETGVIRAADLGTTRAVTHDEAEEWKPLQ